MNTWPGRRASSTQEAELGRRQLQLGSAARRPEPGRVDLEVADAQDFLVGRAVRPAQQRADACDELRHLERLRHVVVGAELEADHDVEGVSAGRQHEDRHPAAVSDLPADLEPVELRKHHVEHHEVVGLGSGSARAPRVRPLPSRRSDRRPAGPSETTSRIDGSSSTTSTRSFMRPPSGRARPRPARGATGSSRSLPRPPGWLPVRRATVSQQSAERIRPARPGRMRSGPYTCRGAPRDEVFTRARPRRRRQRSPRSRS